MEGYVDIKYKHSTEGVDWDAVAQLFQQVGWGCRAPKELAQAFRQSSHVRFAFADQQLVGFGRTVDDGRYYALIVDLVVAPAFQGKGIGSRILTELRDDLESYFFTTLTSAVGKEGFYLKQGWLPQQTAFIWPRSERQQQDHATSLNIVKDQPI